MGIFWGWDQLKLPWFIFPICIIVPNGPDIIIAVAVVVVIISCLVLGAGLIELRRDACEV